MAGERPLWQMLRFAREPACGYLFDPDFVFDVPQKLGKPLAVKDQTPETKGEPTVNPANNQERIKKAGILGVLSQEKQDRATELKRRLADKARNQTSAGLDPEYITLGGELVSLYIEAGVTRFAEMLRDFAETTGLSMREAQAPMRAAYNHVRDDMELAGENVSNMDDAAAVLDEARRAIEGEQSADRKGRDSVDESAEPGTGERVAAGVEKRDRPDGTLEGTPTEDVPATQGGGGAGSDGARSDGPGDGSRVEGHSEDAADRRAGDSGARLAADGAGNGRGDKRLGNPRSNYVISDPEALFAGGPVARFEANRTAIEAVEDIEATGHEPTREELDAMASYIGWGSFGQELF